MEQTNFPMPYIHTGYFRHTNMLTLALFNVLFQNRDLVALLAPRKSVFYSAILMKSLATGFEIIIK